MSETEIAPRSGEELLGKTVLARGLRLGHAIDLVVDLDGGRAVGFEVMCGDGVERFLPIAAADIGDHAIEVSSALMLLDRQGASFYLERATPLSTLRSTVDPRVGGKVVDVSVFPGGKLEALLVAVEGMPPRRVTAAELKLPLPQAPAA